MTGSGDGPDVLFVSHTGVLGGAERVLLGVAGGHVPRGTALLFADGPLRTQLQARGVPCAVVADAPDLSRVRRDAPLLRAALPAVRGMIRVARRVAEASRHADVVYVNSQKAFVVSAFAAFARRRALLWHLHDILDSDHFGRMQIRLVVKLANLAADAVVVPSAAAEAAFVAAGGRADLVRVVHNGVDLPVVAQATPRAELGLPGGPLLGVFSRIARWKGQHVAVAATALLPGVHLLLVGGPQFGEDSYLAELREQVAMLGIADRVTMMGHREDVATLMRAVDVCVHPSVSAEPFGLTVVEAMACGLPVVAARNGAIPEIIDDGSDGLLVEPGEPEALADALRGLLADAVTARRLGDRARQTARERFSQPRTAAAAAAVVNEVAAHGGRRGAAARAVLR